MKSFLRSIVVWFLSAPRRIRFVFGWAFYLRGVFRFKAKIYKKGAKRRTRYECLHTENKRVYLFNQNVEVEKL